MENKKEHGVKKRLILLLLLITVAAVAVSVWAVWFREATPTLNPDYAPQQLEPNAVDDGDDSGERAVVNIEIPVTITVN